MQILFETLKEIADIQPPTWSTLSRSAMEAEAPGGKAVNKADGDADEETEEEVEEVNR